MRMDLDSRAGRHRGLLFGGMSRQGRSDDKAEREADTEGESENRITVCLFQAGARNRNGSRHRIAFLSRLCFSYRQDGFRSIIPKDGVMQGLKQATSKTAVYRREPSAFRGAGVHDRSRLIMFIPKVGELRASSFGRRSCFVGCVAVNAEVARVAKHLVFMTYKHYVSQTRQVQS